MLFALGSNGSGQLGTGHSNDLSTPEPVWTADTSSPWHVDLFAAGGNHTVLLCDDGKVRVTGNNEDGRCCVERTHNLERFTEVPLPLDETTGKPIEIRHISATWSATFFLGADGTVWTCGSGSSGELGLGPGVTNIVSLQRIPAFPPAGTKVVYLASSMGHTTAVLSNRDVYGWGKGRRGQLGQPAENIWWPRKMVGIDFGATKAVCGKDFTLVLGETFTGQMTVFGPNDRDRFGVKADAPQSLTGWKSIATSWGSVFALKESGDIIAWGRNDHGQLPPQGIPEFEAIDAGSEHCVGLTRAGKVLAWGWGEHGNCGTSIDEMGDVRGRWNEIEVPGTPTKIFAGCATSFIETV